MGGHLSPSLSSVLDRLLLLPQQSFTHVMRLVCLRVQVAPAGVRGRVVEVYEFLLCAGMLSAVLMDAALQGVPGNWRLMVGAPIVPASIFAGAVCVL